MNHNKQKTWLEPCLHEFTFSTKTNFQIVNLRIHNITSLQIHKKSRIHEICPPTNLNESTVFTFQTGTWLYYSVFVSLFILLLLCRCVMFHYLASSHQTSKCIIVVLLLIEFRGLIQILWFSAIVKHYSSQCQNI